MATYGADRLGGLRGAECSATPWTCRRTRRSTAIPVRRIDSHPLRQPAISCCEDPVAAASPRTRRNLHIVARVDRHHSSRDQLCASVGAVCVLTANTALRHSSDLLRPRPCLLPIAQLWGNLAGCSTVESDVMMYTLAALDARAIAPRFSSHPSYKLQHAH